MPRLRAFMASLLLLASMLCVTAASAQDELAERRKAAQALADNAFDLMQQGLHEEAASLFRKAEQRFHSPVFMLFEAEAWEKHGSLLKARALLAEIVDEKLAEYAPDAFRKAQMQARERLEALDARIPTITISLPGADLATTKVTVDGKAVDTIGKPLRLMPGQHEVKAESDAGRADSASVELAEGERKTLSLDVAPPATEQPVPEPRADSSPYWIPAAIAFGVGGAGLIVGAAVGGVFVGQADDLKGKCNDTQCDPTLESEGDDVKLLGNVATASLIIGGVGVAAGVVLLLVLSDDEGDGGEEESAYVPRVLVGPTGFSVSGRF